MEQAGIWLKSVIYCICILEWIYHLIQNHYYQKYIRFFGGLILMMTVIGPLLQVTKNEEILENTIWLENLKRQISDMETTRTFLAEINNSQIEGMMKSELEKQVFELTEKCGIKNANVNVSLADDLYGIEKIEVMIWKDDSQKMQLIEVLQDFYKIPEERIEIIYVETNQ